MPNIYLLSKSDVYFKLIDLALKNFGISLKKISTEQDFISIYKDADLIIIDDEFSSDPTQIINACKKENIPVIYLHDVLSEREKPEEEEKFIILEKPFEEKDIIEKIKIFIPLKQGEIKMAEEKKIQGKEDEILELTEVVEEDKKGEEISDLFSTEKKENLIDEFFKEEEKPSLKEPEIEEKPQLEEKEIKVEEEEKLEEEVKIPVDEETKKIAQEIEYEEEEEEEKEEIKEELQEKEITKIDFEKIENKLVNATYNILEAIEESSVEIAKAIAKVTPKIIEEVAKEIIPAIAKKIISEELEKNKGKN